MVYQSAFDERVNDRQSRLAVFDSGALARARILIVGAGGLGCHVAASLARKGAGTLHLVDDDTVEPSNLNRQLYYLEDLFQPKAFALAKNVAREGHLNTVSIAHCVTFNEQSAPLLSQHIDVGVVAVDNDQTRCLATAYFRRQRLPALFCAVNQMSDEGWCFVQEPTGPCLACVLPHVVGGATAARSCTPWPATLDILKAVTAPLVYAVDSLLMPRRRQWNFRWVNLVGDGPNWVGQVPIRPSCPVCGGGSPPRVEGKCA